MVKFYKKIFLIFLISLSIPLSDCFAQELDVKSSHNDVDRLLKVSSGDKIELKVGEVLGIYSDTDDVVDRYDRVYEGAYLNSAHVYFSDGVANSNPNSKYILINHADPKNDFNTLTGVKPTSGYVDMMIYYVVAYFDKKGTIRLASGQYYFQVKVVGKNGEEATKLKKLSLPKEITIIENSDYLITANVEPSDADVNLAWTSSDEDVAYALAGTTILERGGTLFFSDNVSLYVTERDCCIQARYPGTATLTVTADDGVSASIKVNVIPSVVKMSDATDKMWDIYDEVKLLLNKRKVWKED